MLKKLDKVRLLEDVRAKGVEISSTNDLMKIDKRFTDLIPLIIEHLKNTEDESDKEFLVRCLGVKGFTEVTEQLLEEFNNTDNVHFKWAIGNTLSIIEDKSHVNEFLKIVQNKEHGTARQMIVISIGRMKIRETFPILLKLLEDEDVAGHAVSALGYFKDPAAIPFIEPLQNNKIGWIKKEATKVINKLQKLNI